MASPYHELKKARTKLLWPLVESMREAAGLGKHGDCAAIRHNIDNPSREVLDVEAEMLACRREERAVKRLDALRDLVDDYTKMSDADLVVECQNFRAMWKSLGRRRQAVAMVQDARAVTRDAAKQVDEMSDTRRDAVAQAIQAKGVESKGAVGTPGV